MGVKMSVIIEPGDPRDPQATALLKQSHALMESLFPPEDNHFLDIAQLCVPEISFLVARQGDRAGHGGAGGQGRLWRGEIHVRLAEARGLGSGRSCWKRWKHWRARRGSPR